jgi:DNA-binding MarR family transcriptional regulator
MNKDIVDELLRQWARERPKMDVFSLGIVVRIQMLAKLLQQRTTEALRHHDLKHWEYDVLSVLRRQGDPFELAATDIADAALLTSGAMTTRIDGLESRGLVKRRQNRKDRRSVLVRLTGKGKRLVDDAIHSRLEDAKRALANMPLREQRTLADGLRSLLLSMDRES